VIGTSSLPQQSESDSMGRISILQCTGLSFVTVRNGRHGIGFRSVY